MQKIALRTDADTVIGFQIAKVLIKNNYAVFVDAKNIEKEKGL